MGEFIISLTLVLAILSSKIFFYYSEPKYFSSFIVKLDLFILLTLLFAGTYYFLSKRKNNKSLPDTKQFKFVNFTLVALIIIFFSISLLLNLSKKYLDWDAVALYDARAQYFQGGVKFSEMNSLSAYDSKNKYYYALYPPFTSIAHIFWYKVSSLPVSVLYSVFLGFLTITSLVFTRKYLGMTLSLLLGVITISNYQIFSTSIIEYTNLPFTLLFTLGIFLLVTAIDSGEKWRLLFSAIVISGTQWIRFSEPIWATIVISLFAAGILMKKMRKISYPLILILVTSLISYFSWNYFIKSIAHTPAIFEGSVITKMTEAFVGLFTGAEYVVLIELVSAFGTLLVIFIAAATSGLILSLERKSLLPFGFIAIVIISNIFLYYAILYYLVYQVEQWREVAGSVARSITFAIPISSFIIIYYIKQIVGLRGGSSDKKISHYE